MRINCLVNSSLLSAEGILVESSHECKQKSVQHITNENINYESRLVFLIAICFRMQEHTLSYSELRESMNMRIMNIPNFILKTIVMIHASYANKYL